jgi:hypothetical protein
LAQHGRRRSCDVTEKKQRTFLVAHNEQRRMKRAEMRSRSATRNCKAKGSDPRLQKKIERLLPARKQFVIPFGPQSTKCVGLMSNRSAGKARPEG